MEWAGRSGLFNAAKIREEMAAAIPAFKNFGDGHLGDFGVQLALQQEPLALGSGS
jgi:hypothetical protein